MHIQQATPLGRLVNPEVLSVAGRMARTPPPLLLLNMERMCPAVKQLLSTALLMTASSCPTGGSVCVPPSPIFFQRTRVQIWLYENTKMRIEGQILGFDEYMNLVLDEAEEVKRGGRSMNE